MTFIIKPKFPKLNRSHSISDKIVLACPMYESDISLIHDVSGKNHDSTSIDGNPTMSHSPYGQAYDGDGTGDGIGFGNHADFTFGDGSTDVPFSIFVLFKMNSLANTPYLIAKDAAVAREWLVFLSPDGGARTFVFTDSHNNDRIGIKSANAGDVVTGVWYGLLLTYDGSSTFGGLTFYLNGVKLAVSDTSAGVYIATGDDGAELTIGMRGGAGYSLNGLIANTVIWKNRELTANEAQLLNYDPFAMYRPSEDTGWMSKAPAAASGSLLLMERSIANYGGMRQ